MNENPLVRLRAANVVAPAKAHDETLFARIVALRGARHLAPPRGSQKRLRPSFTVVGLAALVLFAAAWTASGFHFNAFSGDPSSSTPGALRTAFMRAFRGDEAIDPGSIATIGTFTTGSGEITVNAARTAGGNGFITQYVDGGGQVVTYMGEFLDGTEAAELGRRLVISSNSLNGMFDGVWQLWGIAPANTARLELLFQDGATTSVPLHDGLFIYLSGGSTCQPGHQPAEFVATDNSGSTIDRAKAPTIDC